MKWKEIISGMEKVLKSNEVKLNMVKSCKILSTPEKAWRKVEKKVDILWIDELTNRQISHSFGFNDFIN